MRLRQITAKLWKFFFMPTDGISGHLYVSQSVVCEMATVQERALCVAWLFERKSVTQTQRNYHTQFNKQPPSDYARRDWQRRFLEWNGRTTVPLLDHSRISSELSVSLQSICFSLF
jgi:hypothetical protein